MKTLLCLSVLTVHLVLPALASSHGGVYFGPPPKPYKPTDTVGAGRGGMPSTPGSPGPGMPGSGPGGPASPATPRPGGAMDSITGGAGRSDATGWQAWWAHNQAPYLRLKAHLAPTATGSDAYRLGEPGAAAEQRRITPAMVRVTLVPRLLEALRTERSDDIQSSCMIALAKLGDPEGPSDGSALAREVRLEIQKRLCSPRQELAETAAIALGIYASRESIPVLAALARNDAPALRALGVEQGGEVAVRTRAFAAYGLGLIGHRAAPYDRLHVNACLRALLDGEARTLAQRDLPVACVTALGLVPLPIDARAQAPSDRPPAVLTSLQDQLSFLAAYGGDPAVGSLVRAHVPTALARLLSGEQVPADFAPRAKVVTALLRALDEGSDADDALRQSAILALGVIGDSDEDAIDKSIRATLMRQKSKAADQQARAFALIALAQAAGRPGRGLGDPLHGVDSRAPQENARTFLMGELAREKGTLRPWAALALALLERSLEDARAASSPDAKLALRACLERARAPSDVGAFAIACGLAREAGARDLLLADLARVRDAEARGHVAVALGLLHERAAIEPLEELARQSKYQAELLRSAAIALGLLGDTRFVPELARMLTTATSLPAQAAIGMALGSAGDARSVPALLDLLGDEATTELARSFAAAAIGILADKEELPWNAKISVDGNYRASTPSLVDGKGGILDIL